MSSAGGTDDSQFSTLELQGKVVRIFLEGERELGLQTVLLLRFGTKPFTHVQRMSIGITVHGDRRDAHLLCGSDHPACDFPSVGDQDFREHSTSTSSAISMACRRTVSLLASRRILGRETKRPRDVSKTRVGPHSGWP